MSKLKKILSIVLVVAILGSALGFFIYNKYGKTYNYAGKDMEKYLKLNLSPESILAMKDELWGTINQLEPWYGQVDIGDKKVGYKIADEISAIAATKKDDFSKLEEKKFANYDSVTFLYYIELEDGTVVSNPALMNYSATTKPSMQLGQNPEPDSDDKTKLTYAELSGLLSAVLLGKDFYVIEPVVAGLVETGDTMWVNYTIIQKNTDNTTTTTSYQYQKTSLATLESLTAPDGVSLSGLAKKFADAQEAAQYVSVPKKDAAGNAVLDKDGKPMYEDQRIGATEVPKVIGNEKVMELPNGVTVKMTVKYVLRAIVTKGEMKDGDTVFFTYKEKNAKETNQMKVTLDQAGQTALNTAMGNTTFFDAVFGKDTETGAYKNKIDEIDSKEFTVVTGKNDKGEDVKTTYVVTVDYVKPVDPADTTREGLIPADPIVGGAGIDVTLTEDSLQMKYDATGAIVKEKEEGKDEAIEVDLKGEKVKIYIYVTGGSRLALEDFDDYYTNLGYTGSEDKELNAFFSAYSAYKTAQKAEEDNTDTTKEESLKTATEAAKKKLDEATAAYNKKIEDENKVWGDDDMNKLIVDKYLAKQRDAVQTEVNNEYAYALAEVVWDRLLLKSLKTIKYPSRALRLAKKSILDDHKAQYYPNRDNNSVTEGDVKVDYTQFKNFDDYLENHVYKDQGVKDGLRIDAKEAVRETMMFYYLVDLYDVELTDDQKDQIKNLKNYEEVLGASFDTVSIERGYLFDNVMRKIAEAFAAADGDDITLPETSK